MVQRSMAADTAQARRPAGPIARGALIGALGVVFGDIGTSPIYTVQTVFSPDDPHNNGKGGSWRWIIMGSHIAV